MGTFYDEQSPHARVPGDSEPGVIGMRAAVMGQPLRGSHAWLPGYYNPDPKRAAYATAFASAPASAYFRDAPPTKFADESQLSTITFRPVPGMEKHVSQMQAGYNPYSTKEPKTRPTDHTSSQALGAYQASQATRAPGSSDDAILSLLMDA